VIKDAEVVKDFAKEKICSFMPDAPICRHGTSNDESNGCFMKKPECQPGLSPFLVRARKLLDSENNFLRQYYPAWFLASPIVIEEPWAPSVTGLVSHSFCGRQVVMAPETRGYPAYTGDNICSPLSEKGLYTLVHELFHVFQRAKGLGWAITKSLPTNSSEAYDDWDQKRTDPHDVLIEFLTAGIEAQAEIFMEAVKAAGSPRRRARSMTRYWSSFGTTEKAIGSRRRRWRKSYVTSESC
jgi:hypothetical protein